MAIAGRHDDRRPIGTHREWVEVLGRAERDEDFLPHALPPIDVPRGDAALFEIVRDQRRSRRSEGETVRPRSADREESDRIERRRIPQHRLAPAVRLRQRALEVWLRRRELRPVGAERHHVHGSSARPRSSFDIPDRDGPVGTSCHHPASIRTEGDAVHRSGGPPHRLAYLIAAREIPQPHRSVDTGGSQRRALR